MEVFSQSSFQKNYGGGLWDVGNDIQYTSDGNYLLSGYTRSFGFYHMYLVKADKNGVPQWSRSFGVRPGQEAFSVKECYDGIIMCGTAGFGQPWDGYIVKTECSGDILPKRKY